MDDPPKKSSFCYIVYLILLDNSIERWNSILLIVWTMIFGSEIYNNNLVVKQVKLD